MVVTPRSGRGDGGSNPPPGVRPIDTVGFELAGDSDRLHREHVFGMEEEIRKRLNRGQTRVSIARELGVSPSTITRWARKLGFPDAQKRPSPVDWVAVQTHYDAGHTIDECRHRFGFSYGAWDKAVTRGDIKPRRRFDRQLGRSTRDRVEALLARGRTQSEITRELGIAKSTVAYHCRRLGKRADPRFARRYEWADVQRAIDSGLSMRRCFARFGFSKATWYEAVERGQIKPADPRIPLAELLVRGRQTSRGHLKQRLIAAGLKTNRCEACGLTEWQGRQLNMQLHHRNGDGLDNRLENLALLCANCHSQTENWSGRNKHRRPTADLRVIEGGKDEAA